MSSTRTRTCQWCGTVAPTATEHMVHVHEAHPETIGRGRSISRPWSCHICGTDNGTTAHVCHGCGWEHRAMKATNQHRTFFVMTRPRPGDHPTRHVGPVDYTAATDALAAITVRSVRAGTGAAFDDVRNVVTTRTGHRLAWLEVAVVPDARPGFRDRGGA